MKRRKKQEYTAPKGTIRHVHELLQLMSVMTGDQRFEEAYNADMEGDVTTMEDVLDRVEERGVERGELKKAKATAIKLFKRNTPLDDIAEILEYNVDTVRQWIDAGMAVAK